jgi:phytoene/squalene synthetase
VSYFYFRCLDDVADGDRACGSGPGRFLDRQSSQWCTGPAAAEAKDEAAILFNFIWTEFTRRNFPSRRARFLALRIIEGLRFDLERRSRPRLVRRAELDDYYAKVVLAPACLAHLILDAHAASEALQEISGLIGRLQSLRDLHADWVAGVINIPLEDLEQMPPRQDTANWRRREIGRGAMRLRTLWEQWPSHADERSRAIMRPAVHTLLRWATRTSARRPAMFIGENALARC